MSGEQGFYVETTGRGEPLLLLHGGFCSLEQLRFLAEHLADRFAVTAYERPGHGRTPDVDGPYGYEASADEAVELMESHGIGSAHLVGYSDGANIALLVALRHPDRVRSLVAVSGNLDPTAFTGASEPEVWGVGDDEDRERELYDELSPDGPDHAEVVLDKLRVLWTTEPRIEPSELGAIGVPTLIMSGERDTIREDHSALIASSIPGAELVIVPGATHDLMHERPGFVVAAIDAFLGGRPLDDSRG